MENLEQWAKKIAQQEKFKIKKELKRSFYYTADKLRSIVFEGEYKGKEVVLKAHDDPRITNETIGLQVFGKTNKSKILTAPKLYASFDVSPKKGWVIMEKLPEKGNFLSRPLPEDQRAGFLRLFLEYRANFPQKASGYISLAENLPADKFHLLRIARWFQLANDKEAERRIKDEKQILNPKKFIPYYQKGTEIIAQEFSGRKMIFCHGHFNPAEVFYANKEKKYFLTDFAHTHFFPEGYELAFIIWSDWIMNADWKKSFSEWKKGIEAWLKEIEKINKILKIKKLKTLMRAALVERCLGTLLADICASDRPRKEQEARRDLVYKFLDELLEK